jgi:hypothetical protein
MRVETGENRRDAEDAEIAENLKARKRGLSNSFVFASSATSVFSASLRFSPVCQVDLSGG